MPSQVFKRGPAVPEMNITPLIDVVFLLIVFFMLVNNIVAEEQVKMIVPMLSDPKTRELGEIERLTVSLVPPGGPRGENPLILPGAAEPQAVQIGAFRRLPAEDYAGITAAVAERVGTAEGPLEVVLRADAGLTYETVQPIMAAITAAGVETVHLSAFLPDEGPILPEGLR